MLKRDPNSRASRLQEKLVQCCIDFIKENGDTELERVEFNADCLQESAKHGSWQSCTDSYCGVEVWDYENNCYKIDSESA